LFGDVCILLIWPDSANNTCMQKDHYFDLPTCWGYIRSCLSEISNMQGAENWFTGKALDFPLHSTHVARTDWLETAHIGTYVLENTCFYSAP